MVDGFDVPIKTDEATAAIKDLTKVIEQFGKDASAAMKGFKDETKKTNDDVKTSAEGIESKLGSIGNALKSLGLVAVGALGIKAIKDLGGALGDAVSAAEGKEAAFAGVEAALKRTGQFSAEAFQGVKDFADQLEATTGLADDQAAELFTMATAFTKSKDEAKKLIIVASDLSAATGKSLESQIRALGDSLNGNIGPLDNVNPKLKDLSAAALAGGAAVELLGKQFEGAAAAKINNFSGAIISIKNALEDIQVAFGETVTKNPAVIEALKGIGDALKGFGQNIDTSGLKDFIAELSIGFLKTIPPLLVALDSLSKAFDSFAGTGGLDLTKKFFDLIGSSISFATSEMLLFVRGIKELQIVAQQTSDFFSGAFLQKANPALDSLKQQLQDIDKQLATNEARSPGIPSTGIPGITPAGSATAGPSDSALLKLADSLNATVAAAEKARSGKPQAVVLQNGPGGGGGGPAPSAGPAGAIDFNFDPLTNYLLDIPKRLNTALDSIGQGFLAGLQTGGEAGAKKAVSGTAKGIAELAGAGGPLAGAIGGIVDLLGSDPETFKKLIDGFVAGIPVILDNIVQNLPYLIETLANNLGPLITAVIAAIPQIVLAIIKAIPVVIKSILEQIQQGLSFQGATFGARIGEAGRLFSKGVDDVLNKLTTGGEDLKNKIGDGGKAFIDKQVEFNQKLLDKQAEYNGKIRDFFVDLGDKLKGIGSAITTPITNAANSFRNKIFEVINFVINSFNSIIEAFKSIIPNVGGGGGGGGVTGLGFKKGGMVHPLYAASGFVPRGTDTVPAMLTPGEVVIPVDLVDGLRALVASGNITGPNGAAAALGLLAEAVDLLSAPMEVRTEVKIKDQAFADIILNLNRRNARLA